MLQREEGGIGGLCSLSVLSHTMKDTTWSLIGLLAGAVEGTWSCWRGEFDGFLLCWFAGGRKEKRKRKVRPREGKTQGACRRVGNFFFFGLIFLLVLLLTVAWELKWIYIFFLMGLSTCNWDGIW